MKWIVNEYDPRKPDAKMFLSKRTEETEEEAWRHYQEWLKDKTIGEPKATPQRTVEELKEMDIVGVYVEDN